MAPPGSRSHLDRPLRLAFAAFVGGLAVGGVLTWSWRAGPADADFARGPGPNAPPTAYAWTTPAPAEFPIPPYAKFLEDVQIVLDPGHIGQRDPGGNWKRGPTGLREAVVNLRVAQFLREFLESVGAKVVLTRAVDQSLDMPDAEDLRHRAAVANDLRADLLLSIHHNAIDGNPDANYTVLFYHPDPERGHASITAARHLLTGLQDAMRLEQHLNCGVLSDRLLYEDGLGLLRNTEVPAVLSEASFHSNPDEEDRLRDPLHNRREAYGLFLGLARWAQAGLPRVSLLLDEEDESPLAGERITVALDDGIGARGGWGAADNRIVPSSLVVRLNGAPVQYDLDLDTQVVHIDLPEPLARGAQLFVDFETVWGQHVLHPVIELGS